MAARLNKQSIPLLLACLLALWWGFYYQSSGWYNDYGKEKSELFLLLDGLLVLPLVCFACIADKRQALVKSLAYGCLMILLGSLVIPESEKLVWRWLESLRYLLLGAFVLFELAMIVSVVWIIRMGLRAGQQLEDAIEQGVDKYFPKVGAERSILADLMLFDLRLWSYFLMPARYLERGYSGNLFSYHKLDGNQANQMGFILLILFELPLTHLLLHFVWSPLAANVVTGLTLLGLVFFIAEYRASSRRFVTLDDRGITVRYGLMGPRFIPWFDIEAVELNQGRVRRQPGVLRYRLFASPNIRIKLDPVAAYHYHSIYLGLDNPAEFIRYCKMNVASGDDLGS
ncbi:PH domain-containing protein [Shewanella corallii]|uniref:PH domain-containing protein n=1 Tax=Shewanella corallii TaxID=560080 RepID=A0ABT0N6Z3_9GAMM|nr:PH domain-containing protein [Shewanella corallii]MCL2914218.1 PH domain-containing protein [Shewanella corallii]